MPLPSTLPRFEIGASSRVGPDSFGATDAWASHVPPHPHWLRAKGAFCAVADGSGVSESPGFASRRAIETAMRSYYYDKNPDPAHCLRSAFLAANEDLGRLRQVRPRLVGQGSTLCAATLFEEHALVAHVGDSRAYLVREGRVWQLTQDQRWVMGLHRFVPQTLGVVRDLTVTVLHVWLHPRDVLVLCSDGVTDMLGAPEIGAIVGSSVSGKAAVWLVSRAGFRGGVDSATSVVVRLHSPVRVDASLGRPGTISQAYRLRPPVAQSATSRPEAIPGWVVPALAGSASVLAGLLVVGIVLGVAR